MLNEAVLSEAKRIADTGYGSSPEVTKVLLQGLTEMFAELKLKRAQLAELLDRLSTEPKEHVAFPVPDRGEYMLACRCGTMLGLHDMHRGSVGCSSQVIAPIQCGHCAQRFPRPIPTKEKQ